MSGGGDGTARLWASWGNSIVDAAVRVTPADLSVVLPTTTVVEGALREAWSGGSGDAGFALGLLLSRTDRLAEAEVVWGKLAHAGHAEALLALAMMDGLRGDEVAWGAGLRAADEAGSMLGAAAVASVEASVGNDAAADAANQRMLDRALSRDQQGSADAALILAGLDLGRGKAAEAKAGYRRAEQRGAPAASLALGYMHFQAGDLEPALECATRAERGGLAAGSHLLALVHHSRREHQEAWDAIHRAILTAARTGDDDTLQAAKLSLRPYGRVWWGQHRNLLVALVILLAAVALLDWKWAVALVGLGTAFAVSQRPIVSGLPMQLPEESGETASLMGVSLAGDFAEHRDPLEPQDPRRRVATERDHRMWRASVVVGAAVALLLPVWAAGALDTQAILRCGSAAMVLLTCIFVCWQWPHLDDPANDETEVHRPGFQLVVTVAPSVFFSSHIRLWIENPVLVPLAEHRLRVRRNRGPLARLTRKFVAHVPAATSVIILATFALAPDQGESVGRLIAIWGAAIEAAVIAGVLVVLPLKAWRAVRERDWLHLVDATGYLLAVALIATLAHLLGWDEPVLDALQGLPRQG